MIEIDYIEIDDIIKSNIDSRQTYFVTIGDDILYFHPLKFSISYESFSDRKKAVFTEVITPFYATINEEDNSIDCENMRTLSEFYPYLVKILYQIMSSGIANWDTSKVRKAMNTIKLKEKQHFHSLEISNYNGGLKSLLSVIEVLAFPFFHKDSVVFSINYACYKGIYVDFHYIANTKRFELSVTGISVGRKAFKNYLLNKYSDYIATKKEKNVSVHSISMKNAVLMVCDLINQSEDISLPSIKNDVFSRAETSWNSVIEGVVINSDKSEVFALPSRPTKPSLLLTNIKTIHYVKN